MPTSETTHERAATGLGLGAVVLWATLAVLTAVSGGLPPFQLTAMTFAVGTVVGLAYARLRGQSLAVLKDTPASAFALGIYGLLGFHVCYFAALRAAPVLEASLITYLWPLLIVVFSALLPKAAGGSALTARQCMGALAGAAGAALVMLDGKAVALSSAAATGYVMAVISAFIWASYSVASRLFAAVPSVAVTGACAATTVAAALLHLAFERWMTPPTLGSWLAILALGMGPTGLAFYIWDEGMKRGNLRLLGVAAYATPLLSTLVLAASGMAHAGRNVWIATILIAGGAWLAGSGKR